MNRRELLKLSLSLVLLPSLSLACPKSKLKTKFATLPEGPIIWADWITEHVYKDGTFTTYEYSGTWVVIDADKQRWLLEDIPLAPFGNRIPWTRELHEKQEKYGHEWKIRKIDRLEFWALVERHHPAVVELRN